MSQDDWTIVPLSGLGHLRFGMSPEDVDGFGHIYGAVASERRLEMPQSVIDETLALFGDTVSEADKMTFLEGIRDSYQGNLVQIRNANGPVVVLEFDSEGLSNIQIGEGGSLVNFNGLIVFDAGSEIVIKVFQDANGVPGRYRSTLAAFDELCIELESFSELSNMGKLKALDARHQYFPDRAIILRPKPYLPEAEKDSYVHLNYRG